jgi:iron complex transport system permease protein
MDGPLLAAGGSPMSPAGPSLRPGRWVWLLVVSSLFMVAVGCLSGSDGLQSWPAFQADPMGPVLLWEIRLPRSLGAWLAGALLGLAGGVAQGVFRNPLADPYLLGSASGGALGMALAMTGWAGLGGGVLIVGSSLTVSLGLSSMAFVGATLAVVLTLLLSRGTESGPRLLLAGVVVGVVLGALTSLVLLWVPSAWPGMQAFLLGTTAALTWPGIGLMAVVLMCCAALAWGCSPVLDGLTLGEATARSLGLPVESTRVLLVAVLALCTATSVAHTGLIAFVGLVAPHLVRGQVALRQGAMVLLSALVGGLLLLTADVMSRVVLAPRELPVGLWTALLGGGYLLWLLQSNRKGWA